MVESSVEGCRGTRSAAAVFGEDRVVGDAAAGGGGGAGAGGLLDASLEGMVGREANAASRPLEF